MAGFWRMTRDRHEWHRAHDVPDSPPSRLHTVHEIRHRRGDLSARA